MSTDRWRVLLALAVLAGFALAIVVFRSRLGTDFWPIDRSPVGPNIVASVIVWGSVLILGVLVYPPIRRRLERATEQFADRKLEAVHQRFDELHARHNKVQERQEKIAQSIADLHTQLQDHQDAVGERFEALHDKLEQLG